MKLNLKNVGRIKNASVEINGITVICGDNDTGKSTVGKLLYCIYASLYNLQESIRQERLSSIMQSVFRYTRLLGFGNRKKATNIINELLDDVNPTKERILGVLRVLLPDDEEESLREPADAIVERIQSYLAVSEDEIVSAFLQRNIKSEFGGKLANVNTWMQRADVSLQMKEGTISFYTSGQPQKVTLENYFSLEKRLIYLDDPFVLDEIDHGHYYIGAIRHRSELIDLIRMAVETEPENVVEEIARNTQLREMIERIRKTSDGNLVFEDGEFMYRHSGLKESLSLVSVSTGLKTFAILRSLLGRGYLEENGIVIMDEPEVHLHPEWQIRLAELTVLLQKTLDLNVVITTHSVEFLTAIDHFSKKYAIREECNFYLTETEKDADSEDLAQVIIRNATQDMEKIYASISEPYLKVYGEMEGD